MALPTAHQTIERLPTDVMGSVEGAAPFFSACALGLIAPFLLFANDLSQPIRAGALIASFFSGRLMGQLVGRRPVRSTSKRLEISAYLIAAVSYLYVAAANLSSSTRWVQCLILTFIIGTSSAMTIAAYASPAALHSVKQRALGSVTGLGFGFGWLLAAAILALHAAPARPAPLSVLHWVAPIAAALEVGCIFLMLTRGGRKLPVGPAARARAHLDVASQAAVLGCAAACTSAAFVAGESAYLTPAMMSALIGGLAILVVAVMRLAGGPNAHLRGIIALGLALVGLIGSLGVYYTSSRLLCIAAATVLAIGWAIFQANRSANQSTRLNSIAWIVGPLISSALFHPHLRMSLLLPALIIAAAAIGISSHKQSHS